MKLAFNTNFEGNTQSIWYIRKGESSAKKVKSLVGFVHQKSDEYIENQPRRFLDKNVIHRRLNAKTMLHLGESYVRSS